MDGDGGLSQSSLSASTHTSSRTKKVAPATQHLHNSSFVQVGYSLTWSLCHHWSGWHIFFPTRSPPFHAYPSGLPRQPSGAACGQQVSRPRRADPPSPPRGRLARVRGSRKFWNPRSTDASFTIWLIGSVTIFLSTLGNLLQTQKMPSQQKKYHSQFPLKPRDPLQIF